MPRHRPIKFETTLEPSLKKEVLKIVKENRNAKTILNVTLGLVAAGGILTFGVAFPKILGEIGKMRQRQKKESREKYRKIWNNFNSLRNRNALEFVREENSYLVYKLTEKGKEKIKKFAFDEIKINDPAEWDEKWRLVIFDVPEKYTKSRNALRHKLEDLGFYQCQKSAWIHPFPCAEEIEFIKGILNLGPFVKLFLVEEMTDGKVLYHFKNLLKNNIIK